MISENGKNFLKQYEGYRNKAYKDTAGIWTIGWGTIEYPNGKRVKEGDTCTVAQAEEYLNYKLKGFEAATNKLIKSDINQNQYDMIVSLMYNIGIGAFTSSTVRKRINATPNDLTQVGPAWRMWNKSGGRFTQGLANRRDQELKIYFS